MAEAMVSCERSLATLWSQIEEYCYAAFFDPLTGRITVAAISIASVVAFTSIKASKLGVAATKEAFGATGCTRSYFVAAKLFTATE